MITIKFIIDKQKSIALDNNFLIGECEYIVNDNTWNIIHTTVNSNYQGQGIAKRLVLKVLENAEKNNIKVIADCSYAKKIINKSKNYKS